MISDAVLVMFQVYPKLPPLVAGPLLFVVDSLVNTDLVFALDVLSFQRKALRSFCNWILQFMSIIEFLRHQLL
jgi:hypothetical protein